MFKNRPSLSLRLSKIFAALTIALFCMFSVTTVFILYSLEDAMFHQQLKQADKDLKQGLQISERIMRSQDLSAYNFAVNEPSRYGEFSFENRSYHYLKRHSGYLLIDVTEQSIVIRGLDGIVLILGLILVFSLIVSSFFANRLSQLALKPFTQLCNIFSQVYDANQTKVIIANIEEEDIKRLAVKLRNSLDEKEQLIEEKLTFNQGMSHELRSPLQVIASSMELISAKEPQLNNMQAYKRLEKAIVRMRRISASFLWLTSKEENENESDVVQSVQQITTDLSDVLNVHKMKVALTLGHDLHFKMPNEVCELIIANLIGNAINHARHNENGKTLTIKFSENGVEFSNDIGDDAFSRKKGFGIGLSLVSKLAQRFDLVFKVWSEESIFFVALLKPNGGPQTGRD